MSDTPAYKWALPLTDCIDTCDERGCIRQELHPGPHLTAEEAHKGIT